MKLLVPRERDSLKQKEQEQLARESTKLSTEVDELRQLKENELKKLQDFQEREFQKFSQEKETREQALANLDADIQRKQAEWAKLLEPLDKQWALYVSTEKKKIDAETARLAELSTDLVLKQQESDIRDEELHNRENLLKQEKSHLLARIEQLKKEQISAEREANKLTSEASRLHEEARKSQESAQMLENEAKIKLREVELKYEQLAMREKELEDRELAVVIKELQHYSPVQGLSVNTTLHVTQQPIVAAKKHNRSDR